jgi:hypothetical protein
MTLYRVTLDARNLLYYTVEAENQDEAIEKAYHEAEEEMWDILDVAGVVETEPEKIFMVTVTQLKTAETTLILTGRRKSDIEEQLKTKKLDEYRYTENQRVSYHVDSITIKEQE